METAITIFKNFTTVLGYRTLPMIVKAIQQGIYKNEIVSIRSAAERGNKKQVNKLKKQLQAFTISGKFDGGRTVKFLEEYYPFVILDIDQLQKEELKRISEEIQEIEYSHVAFLSPSGRGYKIIVKVSSGFLEHQEAFQQVVIFFTIKKVKYLRSGHP